MAFGSMLEYGRAANTPVSIKKLIFRLKKMFQLKETEMTNDMLTRDDFGYCATERRILIEFVRSKNHLIYIFALAAIFQVNTLHHRIISIQIRGAIILS